MEAELKSVPPDVSEAVTSDADDKNARLWATFCHLSAFLGFIGIPLAHILGPLVIWLIKRNDFSFVDDHGKEALNFQISITIYSFISIFFILVFLIGFLMLAALFILDLVFVIMASIKANDGQPFRYPMTIRFIQ